MRNAHVDCQHAGQTNRNRRMHAIEPCANDVPHAQPRARNANAHRRHCNANRFFHVANLCKPNATRNCCTGQLAAKKKRPKRGAMPDVASEAGLFCGKAGEPEDEGVYVRRPGNFDSTSLS